MATILEYNGCPKWRVVLEGEETFLHCPTTKTRISIDITGALPDGASFEEGDADLPTGTELTDLFDIVEESLAKLPADKRQAWLYSLSESAAQV